MKRILKKRNIRKYNKIFAYGREVFPKSDFTNITYLGFTPRVKRPIVFGFYNKTMSAHPIFSAKGGVQVGNFSVCDEAFWGE